VGDETLTAILPRGCGADEVIQLVPRLRAALDSSRLSGPAVAIEWDGSAEDRDKARAEVGSGWPRLASTGAASSSWTSSRHEPVPRSATARRQLSVDGMAGSNQRRNIDGSLRLASSIPKSSAGARSLRTNLGRLLSSFSTARRCCAVWALRSLPLGK
jgi:hypothetical protein